MPSSKALEIMKTIPQKAKSFTYNVEEILEDHKAWENSIHIEEDYDKITYNERCWYQLMHSGNSNIAIPYLHGGGYIVVSAVTHQSMCKKNCRQFRCMCCKCKLSTGT